MQTFLVHHDFDVSMSYLDNKRLNKQLLESRQLLSIMARKSKGEKKVAWAHHPAVMSWEGHEQFFMSYIQANVDECQKRGIKTDKNVEAIGQIWYDNFKDDSLTIPWWFEDRRALDRVISSHQANLYRKEPESYPDWKWLSDWLYENNDWVVCHPHEYRRNGVKTKPCYYYFPSHMEAS